MTDVPTMPGLYFATFIEHQTRVPVRLEIVGGDKRPLVSLFGTGQIFYASSFTDWSGPLRDPREETHGSDDANP